MWLGGAIMVFELDFAPLFSGARSRVEQRVAHFQNDVLD